MLKCGKVMHVMQELDVATYDLSIMKIIFLHSIQEIFQVWGQQTQKPFSATLN